MSDLIDREALLRQIDIDSEDEPGYYGDTWKFIDTIKRMPSALGTNLAEVGTDLISRQAAIDTLENTKTAISENGERYIAKQNAIMRIDALPSAQPEVKQISYTDCANAMLMMWMDKVLTDGEYNRIMDKLNEHEKKKGEDNE